jgi:hypothetical protein
MKFNATSTRDGIIQEIERLTDLGIGYISGDTNRLADFTAIVNRVQHRVWHTIFLSTGNWQYDDSNNEDLPIATANLVEDQASYALPSEALSVQRIEIKDENNQWYRLDPIIRKNIPGAVDEFQDVSGTPKYYHLLNGVIYVYPASDYSQDNSLKVYFERGSVDFATTDTTQTPGFASPYHEIIPIKASIEWLKIKQPASPTLPILIQDDLRIENSIRQYYGQRNKDYRPRIRRAYKSFK